MAQPTRDPAEIRKDIERAREEIEQSVQDLRTNVTETLSWRSFVRRHPGAVFGGALILGMLVARATSRS